MNTTAAPAPRQQLRPRRSQPQLPPARGPLSEAVVESLSSRPGSGRALPDVGGDAGDPLTDDDFHLALYCLYELHYRGFAGVDERWEWDPQLLGWRSGLESRFEAALRGEVPACEVDSVTAALVAAAGSPGPSLSRYLEERGEVWQFEEFVIHRSAYQLKEADPHTWAIPRLTGAAKSALVHVQSEEYGGGVPGQTHAELFETVMETLGLDHRYGAYLPALPGSTLASTNLISMFGLHRRLRGALVGHLAFFEMTSVQPMARYAAALHRLGGAAEATNFYELHVDADTVHQDLACEVLAGGLARDEPETAADIVFGARAASNVENRFARSVLGHWEADRTSLLDASPC